jgi:hypothetical protein
MSELTGTGALARSIVRRDRMRIGVWVGGIVAMTVSSAAGVEGIYPTTADLRRAALVVEGNAAAIAFNGPVQGLETLGGRIAFETGSFTLLLAGLMSVFMLSRQTRAEEESGRLELIRATIVGRHAPMVAALLVVAAMNVAVGAALTLGFIGLGLPRPGVSRTGCRSPPSASRSQGSRRSPRRSQRTRGLRPASVGSASGSPTPSEPWATSATGRCRGCRRSAGARRCGRFPATNGGP